MGCPDEVLRLVERFERGAAAYRASVYNETQVRREFIDPLFKALGWDIDNEAGYAEAYKDIVHEDAIKVGGLTKIATSLVSPSAIAHFSALAHHGLTDQIPQVISAITTRKVVVPSMRMAEGAGGSTSGVRLVSTSDT